VAERTQAPRTFSSGQNARHASSVLVRSAALNAPQLVSSGRVTSGLSSFCQTAATTVRAASVDRSSERRANQIDRRGEPCDTIRNSDPTRQIGTALLNRERNRSYRNDSTRADRRDIREAARRNGRAETAAIIARTTTLKIASTPRPAPVGPKRWRTTTVITGTTTVVIINRSITVYRPLLHHGTIATAGSAPGSISTTFSAAATGLMIRGAIVSRSLAVITCGFATMHIMLVDTYTGEVVDVIYDFLRHVTLSAEEWTVEERDPRQVTGGVYFGSSCTARLVLSVPNGSICQKRAVLIEKRMFQSARTRESDQIDKYLPPVPCKTEDGSTMAASLPTGQSRQGKDAPDIQCPVARELSEPADREA
jgi:hypothetical protein